MAKYLPLLILILFFLISTSLTDSADRASKFLSDEPPCEEWATIKLTSNELDMESIESKMKMKQNINIKSGSLAGREIPSADVFDYSIADLWIKVCACDFTDAPCIPLCCEPNMEASFKSQPFTCTNKSLNTSSTDEDFEKYLRSKEQKLTPGKFFVVHHNGSDSLKKCSKGTIQKHEPDYGAQHIDKDIGYLIFDDGTALSSKEYCFFFDNTQKKYIPIHSCEKSKSSTSNPTSNPNNKAITDEITEKTTKTTDVKSTVNRYKANLKANNGTTVNTTAKPTVKSGASNEPAVAVFIFSVTIFSVICSLSI